MGLVTEVTWEDQLEQSEKLTIVGETSTKAGGEAQQARFPGHFEATHAVNKRKFTVGDIEEIGHSSYRYDDIHT